MKTERLQHLIGSIMSFFATVAPNPLSAAETSSSPYLRVSSESNPELFLDISEQLKAKYQIEVGWDEIFDISEDAEGNNYLFDGSRHYNIVVPLGATKAVAPNKIDI